MMLILYKKIETTTPPTPNGIKTRGTNYPEDDQQDASNIIP